MLRGANCCNRWLASRFLQFCAGDMLLSHGCHSTTSALTYLVCYFFGICFVGDFWDSKRNSLPVQGNLSPNSGKSRKRSFPLLCMPKRKYCLQALWKPRGKITLVLFLVYCELNSHAWPKTGRKILLRQLFISFGHSNLVIFLNYLMLQ